MTKQEIEQAVAALIQPEGKREHDNVWLSGNIYSKCRKCGEIDGICPLPDPITICDDPEDKAYEASMGLVMVWFRKTNPRRQICARAHKKALEAKNELYTMEGVQVEDEAGYLLHWLMFHATPSQIFEIILTALETK